MPRSRKQRFRVAIERHNGRKDLHGTPTYTVEGDWELLLRWPCEAIGAGGQGSQGEQVRGRQTTAATRLVFIGDYMAARNITPSDRVKFDGRTMGIEAAYDPDGTRRKMRLECRYEQ